MTTVGVGGIAQGGTVLPVASTLGFDNGYEEAVVLGTGGNQEIIPVMPGGINVTSWVSPYPGTITLAVPTQNAHVQGEMVQGCYQEVSTVGSSGSSDVYSESLLELNQAAQLARAHAPQFDTSGLTRVIFLKCYPITQILKLEHMLPIETIYTTLDSSQAQVGIHPSAGYIRLPLGTFVLPEGLFRTTYSAGFSFVPEEIAGATALYAADELQNMVSRGAYEYSLGKMRIKAGDPKYPQSRYVLQAQEILDQYFHRRT